MNHTLSSTKLEQNHPLHPEDPDQDQEEQQNFKQKQDIFHILDSVQFTSLEHQLTGFFHEYGIQEMNGFSATFGFTIYKDPEDEKQTMNSDLFQTGTTSKKNLQLQITPDMRLKVTYRIGKEKDYMFSQTKLRYNKDYFFCISIEKSLDENGKDIYNLAMYGIVSLTVPIDLPSEQIFVGSSTIPVFKGEVRDLVIATRALSMDEIQYVAKDKSQPINKQSATICVLEDYQQIHHQTPEQKARQVLSPQQKHSLPLSLSKSHITFTENQSQMDQQMLSEEEIAKKMLSQGISDLEELLLTNNVLNDKCREVSFSFKWLFNTLQQLSPAILNKGGDCLPFICLNRLIATEQVKSDDFYPIYVIELERFMKVIKYAQIPVSKEDIIQIAQTCGWIRYYKYADSDTDLCGLIYDKLMISMRDASMTPQEVREIKKDCESDPHHEDPVENENFEFDSYAELLDQCKDLGYTEEESRRFKYQGLSVRGVPLKGGKHKFCCTKDVRIHFYESLLAAFPDFYFNPDTSFEIFNQIGEGEDMGFYNTSHITIQTLTTYCLQTLELFTEEDAQLEDISESMRKLFQNFTFYDENFITFKEFDTVLKTLYPVVLYSNGEQVIEVFPNSVKYKQLLYAYEEEPIILQDEKQIGGLKFVNTPFPNFITSEIKLVTPFWVDFLQRTNDQSKQWNKIGETPHQLGTFQTQQGLACQIPYNFSEKQKFRVNLMVQTPQEEIQTPCHFKVNLSNILSHTAEKRKSVTMECKDVEVTCNLDWEVNSSGEDFIDYILGGLKINLAFGVDWTASNGAIHGEDSLHVLGKKGKKKWNAYQQLLIQSYQLFEPFSDDVPPQLWGFGAEEQEEIDIASGHTECFSMSNGEDIKSLQDLINAYENTHNDIFMGTRTVFYPILSKVTEGIMKFPQHHQYTLCMIMCDTENYDHDEIQALIVEASDHPISFFFVGIGEEGFTDLLYMNDPQAEFKHPNPVKKRCRKNTHFFKYNNYQDKESFFQDCMAEFQKQVKIFYKMHKVYPEYIPELKQGKTVMHCLHPEKFEPKNEEEKEEKKVTTTKKGKKGKKGKDDDEREKLFQPQYAEVDPEQKEQTPIVTLTLSMFQHTQAPGGSYTPYFKNLNTVHSQIPPEDFNYKKNFLTGADPVNGFKFSFQIQSQIKSNLLIDNQLPIHLQACKGYDWPLTLDEKEVLPQVCEQWNQGRLQVVVQRCAQCKDHQGTSWHDEADFAEKFNNFGEIFKGLFPNLEIVSNYEKPTNLECFDVYIRGVGPQNERDKQGRIWLFRKQEKLKLFLNYFEKRMLLPYDKLVLLSAGYADSLEMEKAQEHFFKTEKVPKRWKNCQDFPCDVPERAKDIQIAKEKAEQISAGTKMICKNWGCGEQYEYSEDPIATKHACIYHPGSYQMGSIHGLWPESWTCCRGGWGDAGCTKGKHRGVVEKKLTHLCLNRGEINPKTNTPDSACGREFVDGEGECVYHSGYFKVKAKDDGVWTCCGEMVFNSNGCHTDQCRYAQWPDEEAKLYFVEKPQYNVNWRENQTLPFSKTAVKSCVYRESIPYKPYVDFFFSDISNIILLANEQETRICMHFGCAQKYMKFKENDNKQAKERGKTNCTQHPGVFDFGHSGGVKSCSEQASSSEVIWQPHWTCCRKDWGAQGCKHTYHWGPVETQMEPLKNGRWPDVTAMKQFKKTGSLLWKNKLQSMMIQEDEASMLWNKLTKGKKKVSTSMLPEICDKFNLPLLVMSEDLSFHFKYLDVVKGVAETKLNNGSGEMEKEAFLKWWFTPIEEYDVQWYN